MEVLWGCPASRKRHRYPSFQLAQPGSWALHMTRYQTIANELASMIAKGLVRAGDRVPSVRSTMRKHRENPGTVVRGSRALEAQGLIDPRPRSGYFVRSSGVKRLAEPKQFKVTRRSSAALVSELIFEGFEAIK